MMQNEKETVEALWKQLQNAGSMEDLRGLLQSAGNTNASNHDVQRSLQFLKLEVFRAARRLTLDDLREAEKFIIDLVLPACLDAVPGKDSETALYGHQARSILTDWIGQYSDAARAGLRKLVYERLANATVGNDPSPAIWTVISLGFRFSGSRDLLRKLQVRDDDVGDAAICAEAALGCSKFLHRRLTGEVLARLKRRPQANFNLAIQELADPKFISILGGRSDGKDELLRQSLLCRIAAVHRDSRTVLRSVWQATEEHLNNQPEAIGAFLLSGAMATACNLPEVATKLLSLLPTNERKRFHLYNCLEKCVLPTQLDGWRKGLSHDGIAALRKDATISAGGNGPGISLEQRIKQFAWQTALCAGLSETAGWVHDAVANEENPRVVGPVAEQAASISLPQISQPVKDWAGRRINMDGGNNVAEFVAASGALQIVASVASPEALVTLLRTGLRVHGEHLRSTAELVEDVSCWLARSGKTEVVDILLHEVVEGNGSDAGRLAISGLRALAVNKLVGGKFAIPLAREANSAGWPIYARARLVESIGRLQFDVVPEEVAESVMGWAKSDDSALKWASIEAVVRLGIYPGRGRLSIAELDTNNIAGVSRPDGIVNTTPARSYVLSLLIGKGHTEFTGSAVEVVETAPMGSAWALLNNLDENLPGPMLGKLVTALRNRILKVQNNASAEPGLFGILAKLSPEATLGERWECSKWLPNARAALADAIGTAVDKLRSRPSSGGDLGNATGKLQDLLGDGVYVVRRAAARSLAKIDGGKTLSDVCLKWVRSGATDLQKRAAEAAVWLPAKEARSIFDRLSAAPEREVREAAARAKEEVFRRGAAAHCVRRLLPIRFESSNDPTKWVLSRYRFGRAIVQLGDDYDLRAITEAASNARPCLPPNANHWLRRLVKDLEEQWTTTTRKWPDPWFSWKGSVEEFDGDAVISTDGKPEGRYKVRYTLWLQPADSPNGTWSWGGSMRFSSRPPLAMIFGTANPTVTIAAIERDEAKALISSSGTNATWHILGSGRYPERKRQEA